MSETERKKKLARRSELQDWLGEGGLIPELYALCKEAKSTEHCSTRSWTGASNTSATSFDCCIERTVVPKEVPQKLKGPGR